MADDRTILVCDPTYPRKKVWVTEAELPLINLIRQDKGIGPVMVLHQRPTALAASNLVHIHKRGEVKP